MLLYQNALVFCCRCKQVGQVWFCPDHPCPLWQAHLGYYYSHCQTATMSISLPCHHLFHKLQIHRQWTWLVFFAMMVVPPNHLSDQVHPFAQLNLQVVQGSLPTFLLFPF
uniref:Uncharacterized protein n=1 Tax=Rhizophora mucronata TaxID=61149 RepID=A0A2P2QAS2_RHIMU